MVRIATKKMMTVMSKERMTSPFILFITAVRIWVRVFLMIIIWLHVAFVLLFLIRMWFRGYVLNIRLVRIFMTMRLVPIILMRIHIRLVRIYTTIRLVPISMAITVSFAFITTSVSIERDNRH